MAHLPFTRNASSPYGAPMGRPTSPVSGKAHLARVRIVGGYDPGGAYWGLGEPLWCAWSDEGEVYLRAPSREVAKARLGPSCSFYR